MTPFDEFTNLYELSKTLRFSLIPVLTEAQENQIMKEKGYESSDQIRRQDKAERFFADNKRDIFEVDIQRKKRYAALKYYLTELHKLFIKDALNKVKNHAEIDFSDLFENYKKFEILKDNDRRKQLAKIINDQKMVLAKYFGDKDGKGGIFQETAEEYYDWLTNNLKDGEKVLDDKDKKQRKNNILLSQNVLLILEKKIKENNIKEKVENDKKENDNYTLSNFEYLQKGELKTGTLTEYFDGWSTYFKNFNDIRGNLYKDDGRKEESEDTEGEARIKKANAGQLTTRIVDENFEIFVRNALWVENNKNNLQLSNFQNKDIVANVSIFTSEFYIHCLLQADINTYNAKIAELNRFFNENKKGGKEIKYLKPLYKQLLLTDRSEGEEDDYIQEFADDDDLVRGLDEFYSHSSEKISAIRNFFIDGKIEDSLDDIQLNENQLHYFCNKYFGSWSYLRNLYYRQNNIAEKNQASEKEDEFRDAEGVPKTDILLSEIKILLDNETKEDFLEAVKNGWFCRDFKTPSQSSETVLKNAKIYDDKATKFENFVSFLKFELRSMLDGRELLTKREEEDKEKIRITKQSLLGSQSQGERVDDILLSKFSEENFVKNLAESIWTKQENFQKAFEEFKVSIEKKQKPTRERVFERKKVINEYCTRVSDVNRFFALFDVPEGVVSGTINSDVQTFKHDNKIVPLFNAIRNYITKRPDEMDKIKLNFDNQLLLGGWAYKTTDYKCRILKKDNNYYLLIIGNEGQNDDSIIELLLGSQIMNYYQQKGQTIFGSVYKGKFGSDYDSDRNKLPNSDFIKNIFRIVDVLDNSFKKPKVKEEFSRIRKMQELGKFDFSIFKNEFLRAFKEKTDIEFSEYRNKKGIPKKEDTIIEIVENTFGNSKFDYRTDREYLVNRIKEIVKDTPKISFFGSDRLVYEITKLEQYFYDVSFRTVDLKNEDAILKKKNLFLFQIYCKDFSKSKKDESTKNLHTLYFEELFSEKNQKKPIFKLSGGAEVFFKQKIDEYKTEQWERKDLRNPKTNKIPNKKRRFTENQILFHLPIALNNINYGESVNRKAQEYIQKNEDMKILGIDRGEKELAYYCLLDKDGKFVGEPKSLNMVGSNIVNGNPQVINYRQKLDIKGKERMMARRSWTKIEGIKDLKQGYISNVVNEIAKLMIQNNAFVCLEELNHGFKKDRSVRIEKGVYQRLEDGLVDKLNYLVFEKTPEGVRNALQLAPENKAIKYWGNQMGAIFYTDAKFTSKTCPNCGFRRRGVESMKTAREIKEKIEKGQLKIFYEKAKDRFRIEYSWKVEAFDFSCEDLYGKGAMETIYSDVERGSWNNDSLKHIFKNCLQDNVELFALVEKDPSFSYVDFGKVFNSLTWFRHTVEKEGREYDRISCPKCHFSTMSSNTQKITNGDANGAYNIARRGLMIFEKIRSDELGKKAQTQKGIESKDLKISLKEWDEETYKQWDGKDWDESKNKRGL